MAGTLVTVPPEKFPWLDLRRYTFSLAVQTDDLVYVSGHTASAYDAEKKRVMCKGDIVEQMDIAYQKIGVILEAAGLGFGNIVRTIDYVTPQGLPKYRETAEVRKRYLGDTPVASTGVLIHALVRPDAYVEVNVIAARGAKKAIRPDGPEFEQYRDYTFAPAVQAGDKLWLSGVMGSEPGQRQRFDPDTGAQAARSYGAIEKVLGAAGTSASSLINVTEYVAPHALQGSDQIVAKRRSVTEPNHSAVTSVVAHRLLQPEAHHEIEATAVVGGHREEIQVPGWEKSYESIAAAPAVRAGNLVYLSAQSAIDHRTGESVVAGYDMAAQAKKAYSNITEVCSAAGIRLSDIVYTVEYLPPTALDSYRDVQSVRKDVFGEHFPAATGIVVHRLPRPELVIQVGAIAIV